MGRQLTFCQNIERSLLKKFRRSIWNQFTLAVNRYELIREGDRVAVCISGGKDSMLMAKLLQMLKRHSDYPFELRFLVMDPGYNRVNREKIESNAALLEIPVEIFETDIFEVANRTEKSPCYLCARMRRGYLYSRAQKMGCNKIALGHHFNDVVETTLLGMFYGAQIQGMMPKLHSTNFKGMELIRPMYCIHEDSIIAWAKFHGLEFIRCACRFTEAVGEAEDRIGHSKREEIKFLLRSLEKENPGIQRSIFRSLHSVSLDTLIGYKTKGEYHFFLDGYEK